MNSSISEGYYVRHGFYGEAIIMKVEKNPNGRFSYRYLHTMINNILDVSKFQKQVKHNQFFKVGAKSTKIVEYLYE